MNLNIATNYDVHSAYIITIKNHETSERLSKRCQESCQETGMPYQVWEAFDGTNAETPNDIKVPEQIKDQDWLNWFKLKDPNLSITEIACVLSHISLWAECVKLNRPIVILEHDAVMDRPYQNHPYYNSIAYLGCNLQKNQGWKVLEVPIYGCVGDNYRFIYKAHAYAIEPNIAKNMLAYVMKQGIHESLDIMIRADIFSIIQPGLFAYDLFDETETTITGRKKGIDGQDR